MDSVFIVLGECGEYSARSVWVSGVYLRREDAEGAIVTRMAKRREYEQWNERFRKSWPNLPFNYFKFPLQGAQAIEHAELTKRASDAAGPKPEYEPAERVELFSLPIGQWQTEYPKLLDEFELGNT